MHRKLAVLILYSALLLMSGYILGRSTGTAAMPGEAPSSLQPVPAGGEPTTTAELTDWPNLTP